MIAQELEKLSNSVQNSTPCSTTTSTQAIIKTNQYLLAIQTFTKPLEQFVLDCVSQLNQQKSTNHDLSTEVKVPGQTRSRL